MLKRLAKKLLNIVWGRRFLQKFYFLLNWFSLKAMNYGGGSSFQESGEINALSQAVRGLKAQKFVMFDVGANVGNYAKAVQKIFSDYSVNSTIYCFEPSLITFEELEKNTKELQNIQRFNLALHNKTENLTLYSDQRLSGLASVYERNLDFLKTQMSKKESVQGVRLDDFCKSHDIDHINFLKLDVEGNELKVLEGAGAMLKTKVIDNIQFEFGGANIDSRTYFKDFYYLLKDNYNIFRILPNALESIKAYNERLEIFFTVNYLAILKK
jgi:FkbM family methyltransferase